MTSSPVAATLVACGPSQLLRLRDDGSAELVDFGRASVMRLDGELAVAMRAFAAGGRAGPALEALAAGVDALADALASRPESLDAPGALARGGFDTLFLEVTGTCNERCLHCYAGSSPEVAAALDEGTCLAVLDEAARLGFRRVQLTGGDPLLCRFLPRLVARAAALGAEVEIFTNGLALGDALLDELAPHRPDFALSLYSHDAATHDAITRTKGSHARTLAAIGRVVGRGLTVRAAMVLMEANAGHLEETRALARRLGVERFGWAPMRASGRGGFFDGSVPEPGRVGESTPEVGHRHRSVDVDGSRPELAGGPRGQVGTLEGDEARDSEPAADGGHRPDPSASSGRGTLAVLASGEVVPCIFNRGEVLGSVRDRRLGDIVASPRLAATPVRPTGEMLDACHRSLQCVDCRRSAFALRALAEG